MTDTSTTASVTSPDGAVIEFDKAGSGPALILVDGALCYRDQGPMAELAGLLADRFTIYRYDRRGRGGSTDAQEFTPRREVEDIAALVKEAGGSAMLFGISSGAALALAAADSNLDIPKLAIYEPPFVVDDTKEPTPADTVDRLRELLARGRRGEMVKLFMRLVGVPKFFVALMPLMPAWSKMTKIAHTLPYDMSIMVDKQQGEPLPADTWAGVTQPVLVLDGGKSPQWMRNGVHACADVLVNAEYRTLPGQTHMIKPAALAPAIAEFLS
jgi:pimeloyl-ACP methyl ester carboxylesterase